MAGRGELQVLGGRWGALRGREGAPGTGGTAVDAKAIGEIWGCIDGTLPATSYPQSGSSTLPLIPGELGRHTVNMASSPTPAQQQSEQFMLQGILTLNN